MKKKGSIEPTPIPSLSCVCGIVGVVRVLYKTEIPFPFWRGEGWIPFCRFLTRLYRLDLPTNRQLVDLINVSLSLFPFAAGE